MPEIPLFGSVVYALVFYHQSCPYRFPAIALEMCLLGLNEIYVWFLLHTNTI